MYNRNLKSSLIVMRIKRSFPHGTEDTAYTSLGHSLSVVTLHTHVTILGHTAELQNKAGRQTTVFFRSSPWGLFWPQQLTLLRPQRVKGVLWSFSHRWAWPGFHLCVWSCFSGKHSQVVMSWTSGKLPDECSVLVSKIKHNSSQKKISMAFGILSDACLMHVPPFHYFCIHSVLYELLPGI